MASSVIGSLRVNLGIDSAQFQKGLKNTESRLQRFGKFARTGLLAVGAAAGTAAAGMGILVRSTINTADEMSKAAKSIGVPIEELSRLRYAADLSGVSFGQLQTGVGRLSRQMNDAATGLASAQEAFDQLGVEVTKSDGSLRSVTDVMADMSDRFAAMPDGAEKTALAMELMGRSGANMIPLLNDGSESLRELTAEADTFGQVFTQEMAGQAEAFNDNLSRLAGTMGNVAASIATELLPHLVAFSQWAVENGPAIRDTVVAIAQAFIRFGQDLAKAKAEIDAVIEAFRQFRDQAQEQIAQVRQAIVEFADSIVGVFRGIPAQMEQLGRDIIQGLWDGMRSLFSSVRDSVSGFATGIGDRFKSVLGIQSPSTVFAEFGRNIMQGLANGLRSASGEATGALSSIVDGLTGVFEAVIDGSKSAVEAIKDLLSQLAQTLANEAFQLLFGGGLGSGSLLGGIFSFFGLPGFANGGSFQVGGSGGMDSQLVAFRASPNETVTIDKPGEDRNGGEVNIQIVNNTPARVRQERENRGDDQTLYRFIIDTVNRGNTDGDLDESQRGRFGLSPTKVFR